MQRPNYRRRAPSVTRPETRQVLDRGHKLPGMVGGNHAAEAYNRFAPVYDEFNAQNDYEVWLGEALLPEIEKHGLREKGWVLDVGCGTGRAFEPLLRRGFSVHGKDVSREMVERAAEKLRVFVGQLYEGEMRVGVADARELQPLRPEGFDLILALNDVVNYLTEDGDLEKCFEGMKRNLAPQGLVCFDANCLSVYEEAWVAGRYGAMRERGWNWTGLTASAAPGRVFEAEVGAGGLEPAIHRQRHWPQPSIEAALSGTGLRCLAALGQRGEAEQITLDTPPDEGRDSKLIYIAEAG